MYFLLNYQIKNISYKRQNQKKKANFNKLEKGPGSRPYLVVLIIGCRQDQTNLKTKTELYLKIFLVFT